MAARKKKRERGPLVPLEAAYSRIGWECVRCNVIFMSATAEPFCPRCVETLERTQAKVEE